MVKGETILMNRWTNKGRAKVGNKFVGRESVDYISARKESTHGRGVKGEFTDCV